MEHTKTPSTHMKRCLHSLAIREIQVDTTMRGHKMASKKKIVITPNANEETEKLDYSYIAGGNI